jgi:hypothetical protein
MAFLFDGLRGILGFDLLGKAHVDRDDDSDEGLTALGCSQRSVAPSTAGVRCKCNRFTVSEVFDAGQGASNDESSEKDTDCSSDSDNESPIQRPTRYIRFKLSKNQDVTNHEEYLSSVLNWKAEPYVGQRALSRDIKFGPFTLAELESSVKDASDATGFFAYAHKGARKTASSCSVRFGCDCARKRYGLEKTEIEQKNRDFTKDMDEVVRDTSGKRKKQRKGGGCLKAHTQRSRAKAKECSWAMCLKAVVEEGATWCKETRTLWTLNSDPRCVNNFVHSYHCRSPHKRKITSAIKSFICDNGDSMMVHQIVQAVYRKFAVEISSDQVKYILRCNNIRNKERARGSCRAGGAGDSVDFLLQTMKSDVLLLLNNCTTGKWFTGLARLSKAKNDTEILLTEYKEMRAKVFKVIDESRVLDIDGERFLVWSAAWNYPSEKELFSAYPEVVQLDCMHGVTSSTDGFNAVGIDGNGHNIQIMRAFVANQDSNVFRWLFREAFAALVASTKGIRVFLTDGCQAMISELEAACGVGQQFQCAKILRCIFHLITKAFDDQFLIGDGWQADVKKFLYKLRKCETNGEFDACSEFVLRKIAGMPLLGEPQSVLRAQVLRFVKRRIDCAPLWVLKDHLHLPTRGCMATARVEGTHGHDRVTDRINARNSWYTSTKRHSQGSDRRHRAKQSWSRRQLGSKLLRDPMNAQDSVFQKSDLDVLDAVLLPWALETLEEQALLALGMKIVFEKKGYTPETKKNQPHASRKPLSGVFDVWVQDDEVSDDGDDLTNDQREPERGSSDSDSSSSDESSSDSTPSKKKKVDSGDPGDPFGDNMDEEDNFDTEAYIKKCHAKPLPNDAAFHWIKVRQVTVAPQYDDRQNPTGKYVFLCSCGFQKRIGVSCRHILAVLFQMIMNNSDTAEEGENGDDACYGDPTTIDWSAYPHILEGLCSMNICSKIKYHAALHHEGHLFRRDPALFKTSVPKHVPQTFLNKFVPDKDEIERIPVNGLPPDSDDIQAQVVHHIHNATMLILSAQPFT